MGTRLDGLRALGSTLGFVLAAGCGGVAVPTGTSGSSGQGSSGAAPSDTGGSTTAPPGYTGPTVIAVYDAGPATTPTPVPPGPGPGPSTGISTAVPDGGPVIIIGPSPVTPVPAPPSQAFLVTLADGQTCPRDMAIDEANVYWTECGDPSGGYVLSVPKAGGPVVTLATGARLSGIAVGGSTVYWVAADSTSSTGAIMSVPVDGGTPAELAGQSGSPSHLVLDNAYAYWSETFPGDIMRAALDGGGSSLLTSTTSALELALSDTSVYWFDNQGLTSVAKTGGTAVQLAMTGPFLPNNGLAVNETGVYFTSGPPGGSPGVSEVGLDGGAISLVATTTTSGGFGVGGPVALDAARVYWADFSGAVYAAPLTGGTATLLATGQVNVVSIAVDRTAVYWLANGNGAPGSVMKLPLSALGW